VNTIAVWFGANFLIVTLVARKLFRKPKAAVEMRTTEDDATNQQQQPRLARFRWLWLAVAALLALTTPGAIVSAVHLAQTDHRMVLIAILALTMRLGWISLFLWLWWKHRPRTQP
jgi:hypothetical protein